MTASNDTTACRQRLAKALKVKFERDFAEFISPPTEIDLSASELERRVTRIMATFDAVHAAVAPAPPLPELIAALARAAIARLAPHELALFTITEHAFFAHPEAVLHPATGHAAGFGATKTPVALAPVALYISRAVMQRLDSEPDAESLKAALAQRLAGKAETRTERMLSADTMAQLRAIALDSARQVHLPEPAAQQLTEAIVDPLSRI